MACIFNPFYFCGMKLSLLNKEELHMIRKLSHPSYDLSSYLTKLSNILPMNFTTILLVKNYCTGENQFI